MKRLFALVLLLLSGFFLVVLQPTLEVAPDPPEPVVKEEALSEPVPQIRVVEERFPANSSLQAVLLQHDLSAPLIHQLIEETREVYNLKRVRAGNRLQLLFDEDSSLHGLDYEISDEEFLEVRQAGGRYQAELRQHEFEIKVDEMAAVINDSLYSTLKRMGEKDQLIGDLNGVLQWDVDFTTIQKGDWFKVIVEKKYREETFVKYGRILAVQFNTGDRDIYALRFASPETGVENFFDDKGRSVRKAFLKVPFRFSPRISSGFNHSRFHPILKRRLPHLALDFAAPQGTPVLASANGKVTFAGWNRGFGKQVKIRHSNGYVTQYNHLSRILVKAGRSVQQGEAIGRVGATGLATAAHLDYRIQDRRGRFLDPRKRIAWPSDKPVDKRYWSEFVAVREAFLERLASLQDPLPPKETSLKAD